MIFSKPSITYTYLETNFNRGCEVQNILGEDNSNMIVNSIEITNIEFFNNLNDIIMENEELYDKIITLATLNSFNENSSIICSILHILLLGYLIRAGFVGFLGKFFEGSIISKIFDILWFKNWELAGVCLFLYDFLDCDLGST